MNPLLHINDVEKTYGSGFRLGPIQLQLIAGDTVALLGKNGAGKSTLFQLITGNLDSSAGTIFFDGKKMAPDAFLLKQRLGYLPQNLIFPRWISGRELLTYAARLHEYHQYRDLVTATAKYWECASYLDKPLAACSYGMQKRVGLALATMFESDCAILDEPFSGLDLFQIRALEEIIQKRARDSRLTIVSTHDAHYAARLCNRAVIIRDGKIAAIEGWERQSTMERIEAIDNVFFGGTLEP